MKYIFWDFNGTVLDDAHLCHEILNQMLMEEERPIVTFEEYLMIFDFPVESYYAKVYDLEKTSFKVLAHRFIERYQPRSLELKLHQGVIEAIKYYEQKGFINVMFSASEINNLKNQLTHYNIDHLFMHILGTSDVYAKSKVEVARRFIKDHQIDPHDIIMIGDTLHDAEVAKELGFKIVLYTKGHQHPKRLKAFKTIDSMSDLYKVIQ